MNDTISLSEKIYFLSIHPTKGGVVAAAQNSINYVLLGTLFMELCQQKNITFVNKRIIVLNSRSSNPVHQILLEKMSSSKRNLKVSTWINKLAFLMKKVRKLIQNDLDKKRLIRMEDRNFLFFRWQSPVVVNKQLLYKMQTQIASIAIKGTDDEEDILLLSFLKPAGLMRRIFPDKEQRKLADKKLKELMKSNQVSMAVRNAIAATQAVAASVAVTAATSS